MTTGPRVGSSSVAWETPDGVMTSIVFGMVDGPAEQIGAVPPGAHTPNRNGCGVGANPRAWSGLNPSCPVSTTLNPQPDPGVPNCASGSAMVIAASLREASTNGDPAGLPEASHHTGAANPCASARWLQAPDGEIE